MSAIGPGDWVECVAAHDDGPYFRVGGVYRVSSVGLWNGDPWLNLEGKPTPTDMGMPEFPGWDAQCFRPIYRPKADLIESLKTPVWLPEWNDLPAQKPLDVPA